MKVPTVATEMRVIVLLKEFIFTGREVVQRLLLEDSSGFSAFIQESPGFSSGGQRPRHQRPSHQEAKSVGASHSTPGDPSGPTPLQHGARLLTRPLALALALLRLH